MTNLQNTIRKNVFRLKCVILSRKLSKCMWTSLDWSVWVYFSVAWTIHAVLMCDRLTSKLNQNDRKLSNFIFSLIKIFSFLSVDHLPHHGIKQWSLIPFFSFFFLDKKSNQFPFAGHLINSIQAWNCSCVLCTSYSTDQELKRSHLTY